jgi:hypothetical protein
VVNTAKVSNTISGDSTSRSLDYFSRRRLRRVLRLARPTRRAASGERRAAAPRRASRAGPLRRASASAAPPSIARLAASGSPRDPAGTLAGVIRWRSCAGDLVRRGAVAHDLLGGDRGDTE